MVLVSSFFGFSVSQGNEGLRTKNDDESVFRENGRGRKAAFAGAAIAQVFLLRHLHLGPVPCTDPDDPRGADAFDDEVRFKLDLDAAAAQRDISRRLGDVEDGTFGSHVRRTIVASGMLQGILGPIDQHLAALLEIGVE